MTLDLVCHATALVYEVEVQRMQVSSPVFIHSFNHPAAKLPLDETAVRQEAAPDHVYVAFPICWLGTENLLQQFCKLLLCGAHNIVQLGSGESCHTLQQFWLL